MHFWQRSSYCSQPQKPSIPAILTFSPISFRLVARLSVRSECTSPLTVCLITLVTSNAEAVTPASAVSWRSVASIRFFGVNRNLEIFYYLKSAWKSFHFIDFDFRPIWSNQQVVIQFDKRNLSENNMISCISYIEYGASGTSCSCSMKGV